jgi:hypothetical protein
LAKVEGPMTATETKFIVDGRPVSWNQAHGGVHWAKRKAVNDEVKWMVKMALSKYRINKTPFKRPVSIHFDVYVGRPIDCDNVMLKMYIDGLRDWGCLTDDDPRFVKQISVRVYTKQQWERLEVTIIS